MSAPALRRGDKGPEVTEWQRTLVALGHRIIVDGDFGPRTDAATRAFQASHGLTVDGIVGPRTRAAAAGDVPPPPRVVVKLPTPFTETELRDYLSSSHVAHFGERPSPERLACAWAHVAHENGRGRAVWNYNLGNITAFGKWSGSYYVIRVAERVKRDPDVWQDFEMRFRAHATPEAGAVDYWAIMAQTFAAALPLFDAGDPSGAAIELGRLRFYTAPSEPYARSMAALYREAIGRLVAL